MLDLDYILELREDLKHDTAKFLTGQGWQYTSDTPGCCWMWVKLIGTRSIMTSAEHAVEIEIYLSEERKDQNDPRNQS